VKVIVWKDTSWFVAVIAVAVMVNFVAVMVCGRHCRTPLTMHPVILPECHYRYATAVKCRVVSIVVFDDRFVTFVSCNDFQIRDGPEMLQPL